MLRLRWYHLAALVFIVGMIASPALADEIVLTLDFVDVSDCDTPWNESSCALWFTETIDGDYGYPQGYCLPSPQPDGVYIMPARLVVDVSTIEGIESIEVDYQEASDPGRTRVFLYDGDGTAFVEEYSVRGGVVAGHGPGNLHVGCDWSRRRSTGNIRLGSCRLGDPSDWRDPRGQRTDQLQRAEGCLSLTGVSS